MSSLDLLSRLRDRLADVAAAPDGRLPPERRLAEEFGVSRAEIRKALAVMETEAEVVRHVGRGTFLRSVDDLRRSEIGDIAQRTGPREAMQARLIIEPELAALAAINASAVQIAALWRLSARMREAKTWADYETHDARFHQSIADASGNNLLIAVHGIVNGVRRAVIWGWLDTRPAGPAADYSSFAEHDAICAAIEQHDRIAAAEAMRRHLRTTNARLVGNYD